MERETLSQKLAKYILFGTMALGMPSSMYLIGNDIYSKISADKMIVKKSKTPIQSPISIYGFDRDKDGQLDEIREHFAYYGAKAIFIVQHKYHTGDERGDERFEELKRIFD